MATAAAGERRELVQQNETRIPLTPTGLLMEGDNAHPPYIFGAWTSSTSLERNLDVTTTDLATAVFTPVIFLRTFDLEGTAANQPIGNLLEAQSSQ